MQEKYFNCRLKIVCIYYCGVRLTFFCLFLYRYLVLWYFILIIRVSVYVQFVDATVCALDLKLYFLKENNTLIYCFTQYSLPQF